MPDIDPLAGPRLRLDRAWHHLESLDREIEAYFARQPYVISREDEAEHGGTDLVWRVHVRDPLPRVASLSAGDCIHNLRSALDHVAWGFGRLVHDPPPENTEFVICRSPETFQSSKRKIVGVLPAAQTVIEQLQPYHIDDPTKHPLFILHRLWNDDKHRGLPVLGGAAMQSQINIKHMSGMGGFTPIVNYGPFEDGGEVARFSLETRGPDTELDVDFDFTAGVSLAHGGAAHGALVNLLLRELYWHVRDVVLAAFVGLL